MLTNVTTPLLGVIATAVIGRLGEAHLLGGVAMASVAFDCIFWLFGFLRMGTVAFTAQALGAGDKTEQRAVLARALLIAGAIGLALIALQVPLAAAIFSPMGGSEAVTTAAKQYFFVRLWSAPFALANYVMLGWLIGLARAKTGMAIQIFVNLVNMALMAALVLKLDAGITGAALASVLAECVGLVLGLSVAWHILGGRLGLATAVLFDRERLMRMLAVNRDIMIRTAALIAAFLFFTARGARAGDVTLAANAVLHNFTLVGAFFLDGMATAAEQLCGQAYGARDRTGFSRAVKLVLGWGFVFGVTATLLFFAIGPWMIDVMTASEDVRDVARRFLWLAALAPVCGVMAFCYDGIYVGATWARDMRNLMIAALAIYLATWWLTQPLDNTGLWIAILVFFISRGGLQAARYPALVKAPFA
ncbi:MATE family efflux transporter [Pseudolabrys taiwanensis]|uniref:MATE family efflux transporter n=1 Tax=Pseudolabrys taiwanensis TaxID=331696 RepID=A0A346A4E6_9HYPH|nr:MATE family efflux transporter [Pseudolabrys taiwanensis]AXK84043.1 MATE family efflux transporter [Pseudolabrys taiwanensis]